MPLELLHEDRAHRLAEEDLEQIVRDGLVPPDALVRDPPAGVWVRLGSIDRFKEAAARAAPQAPRALAGVPWLTALLVGLDLRSYLVGTLGGAESWPARRAGLDAAALLELGQVHRLFSHALAHADRAHLGVELFLLLAVGCALERAIGRANLLAIWLAGAFAGGLAALAIPPGGAGSAGVGCALIAAAAVFARRHGDLLPRGHRRALAWSLAACLAAYLVLGAAGAGFGAILGGLLGGAGLQALLHPRALARHRGRDRAVRIGAALAAVAVAAVLARTGPLLVRLETCSDRGLVAACPAGWVTGRSAAATRGRLSPAGHAALLTDTAVQPAPVRLAESSARFLAELASAGSGPEVRERRVTELQGWPAEFLVVELPEDAAGRVVRAMLVAHGHYLHRVVLESAAVRETRDLALWNRILSRVRIEDPQSVGVARRQAELRPASGRAQMALATELGRAGHPIEALRTWLRAGDLDPTAPEPTAGTLALMATYELEGRRETAVAALEAFPAEPSIRIAAAEVFDSLGDPEAAGDTLVAGWRLAPGDADLRQALLLRGIAVPVAPGLPDLSLDPTLP